MRSEKIFKIIFIAWVAMWLLFLVRGLVKGEARDYANLFGKSLDEKRAYVTGEEFYRFISFCKKIIPEDSDYTVEADYDATMDYFRFSYYIYPALRDLEDPEYIACYKVDFESDGYSLAAFMDESKYVLKRNKR